MIRNRSRFGQDRGNEEIFRTRIGRALINVQILLAFPRAGHGQGRLADAWLSGDTGREREVLVVDDYLDGSTGGSGLRGDAHGFSPFEFSRMRAM